MSTSITSTADFVKCPVCDFQRAETDNHAVRGSENGIQGNLTKSAEEGILMSIKRASAGWTDSLNNVDKELTAQVFQAQGGYFFDDRLSFPWAYPTA